MVEEVKVAIEAEEEIYADIRPDLMLLGNRGVGKTKIINRHCQSNYNKGYMATTGIEFAYHNHKMSDGLTVNFKLWDTGGDFHAH